MSLYDGTYDDDPLDVTAVSADDQLVEGLRRSLSPEDAVVWDDDDNADDPVLAMLRSLQRDVSLELPQSFPLPTGAVPLVGRRRLGRGATIAAVTAGVLSIGGVAAAASSPGSALHGVRSAVSAAVSQAVDAITPNAPIGPSLVQPSKSPKPSVKPTPGGDAVSAAARSAAAGVQVSTAMDKAQRALELGHYTSAKQHLVAAARKLPAVTDPAMKARLATRLASLEARLAASRPAPTAKDNRPDAGTDNSGKGKAPEAGKSEPPDSSSGSGSSGSSGRQTPGAEKSTGSGAESEAEASPGSGSAASKSGSDSD